MPLAQRCYSPLICIDATQLFQRDIAERFLGAFGRFYRTKGPFQNLASAQKQVALLMLGYVFETCSAEAAAQRQGRCPLQLAGYAVGAIPLFHLLNRPHPSRLRQAMAAGYDLAA